jgi:hypothetical protein
MRPNTIPMSAIFILAALILSGCGKSSEEMQAQERALDNNSTMLASCGFETVSPVRISTLSGQKTAAICEKMTKTLGKNPSVRLLRQLSKAVSLLPETGRNDDRIGNAYQFMRIAESRGQLENDDAMIATFNVVFKIVSSMDGRVTAKDLNIFLSNLGRGAKTMSDDGLIHGAAVLSVMRQNQGE